MNIKYVLFLIFAVAVYSTSNFFTKQASNYEFMSHVYILCLCGVVGVLACYAVLWQMALKKVTLSQAYPFRSLSVVFGLAIAYFAFREVVTWQNLLGCIIVLTGLLIISTESI